MASLNVNMNAVKIVQDLTFNIQLKNVKELRLRLWVAMRLIKMAAWIANMGLVVKTESESAEVGG